MKRKKFKIPKKRDPVAKDLLTSGLYKSKIVPSGKRKKPKHKRKAFKEEICQE